MSLIAEDGNLYPFEMEQYGVELSAGKTIDAVVTVETAGRYALYDRALGLTNWLATGGGMLTYLQFSEAACSVNADCDDDLYCNGTETCAAGVCQAGTPPVCDDGVFCNGAETCNEATDSCDAGTPPTCDDGVTCTDDSCNLGTDSCDNIANDTHCPDDGLFCNGAEFCDAVLGCSSTGDPCQAGETCSELLGGVCETAPPANLAPIANDDLTSSPRGTTLNDYNIIANDLDPDCGTGSPCIVGASVVITTGSTTQAGGTVTNNLDGTITYDPKNSGYQGTDLFQYTVEDQDGALSNVATVRINVVKTARIKVVN
jgi:hypothetical protein